VNSTDIKITSSIILPDEFIEFPKRIFSDLDNYVAPLDLDVKKNLNFKKHPFWKDVEYCVFIATHENEMVGRGIAIYNSKYVETHSEKHGFFGYLDVVDQSIVFNLLIDRIESYLRQFGCTKLVGPFNPSINYELGVLTSGFERMPFFMMTYNPPYYEQLYVSSGFSVEAEFYAFETANVINLERINRVKELAQKRYKAKIKEFNFSDFKNSVREICEIYNDAFDGHYGYLPMSFDEFFYVAKDMKLILDKRFLYLVSVNDEVAGFILALPNLNEVISRLKNGKLGPFKLIKFLYYKRKIKHLKVMIAAIKKKYKHMGLGSLLYAEMAQRVYEYGYDGTELSWVAYDNHKMLKAIKDMGGEQTKTYALFSRKIKSRTSK